jgi:hypothetical protein
VFCALFCALLICRRQTEAATLASYSAQVIHRDIEMSDAAPMSVSFARLWQQQEYSDLNIVLTVGVHADQEAQACTQLAVFPGHKALLSTSQVFEAQVSFTW